MTTKRFEAKTIPADKRADWVVGVFDEGTLINNFAVVKLLNSLVEENEELKHKLEVCRDARLSYKQDWKACVSYCDTYQDEISILKDNIEGLTEEREQLKQELKQLKNE